MWNEWFLMQAFVTDSLNKLYYTFTSQLPPRIPLLNKLRSFMPLRAALAKSGPLYFPSEKSVL